MLPVTALSGMILAAEYTPSPLQVMLPASRQSGIGESGNREIGKSPVFPGPFSFPENRAFGIWPGIRIGKSPVARFGRERELPGVSPALIFD